MRSRFLTLESAYATGKADTGLPYLLKAVRWLLEIPSVTGVGACLRRAEAAKVPRLSLKGHQLMNSSSVRFNWPGLSRTGLKEQAKQEFDRCAALNAAHSSVERRPITIT